RRPAARQAQRRLATDQAAAFSRRALELAAAAAEPDPRLRCSLLIDLGDAERRSGQHAARNTLLEAVDSAIELKDGDSAARAAIGSGRGIFSVAGEIDSERLSALRRTLALVGPGRTAQRARLLAALGAQLLFDRGRFPAARASAAELELARE